MATQSPAVKLQNELLDKGFRSIEKCDIIDDGVVTITHYALSKEIRPSDNRETCPLYHWHHLADEEAVQILEKWISQTVIYPDPRNL
jgi:hypothetical protein